MAEKKGSSEEVTGVLGREHTEHRDESGARSGWSEKQMGLFGQEYIQHHDETGAPSGWSEKQMGLLGQEFTQHHDETGAPSGWSEKQMGLLGQEYTQHYGQSGGPTGWSERTRGFAGREYVQHHGTRPDGSSHVGRSTGEASAGEGGGLIGSVFGAILSLFAALIVLSLLAYVGWYLLAASVVTTFAALWQLHKERQAWPTFASQQWIGWGTSRPPGAPLGTSWPRWVGYLLGVPSVALGTIVCLGHISDQQPPFEYWAGFVTALLVLGMGAFLVWAGGHFEASAARARASVELDTGAAPSLAEGVRFDDPM